MAEPTTPLQDLIFVSTGASTLYGISWSFLRILIHNSASLLELFQTNKMLIEELCRKTLYTGNCQSKVFEKG